MPTCIETYQVDEVYTSDTKLSQVGGSYTVYNPVNKQCIIPVVRETFSINEVDGQELFAPNQVESQYRKIVDTATPSDNQIVPGADANSFVLISPLKTSQE